MPPSETKPYLTSVLFSSEVLFRGCSRSLYLISVSSKLVLNRTLTCMLRHHWAALKKGWSMRMYREGECINYKIVSSYTVTRFKHSSKTTPIYYQDTNSVIMKYTWASQWWRVNSPCPVHQKWSGFREARYKQIAHHLNK